jgi:hypothetical protein
MANRTTLVRSLFTAFPLFVLSASVLVGCGAPPKPTLAEAVQTLKSHRDVVKAAFDAGAPEDCHETLHEVGLLIEQLPSMAEQARLQAADMDEVKQAANKLMDAFGKIDKSLHGDPDGATYSDVASEVDAALATLERKVGQ